MLERLRFDDDQVHGFEPFNHIRVIVLRLSRVSHLTNVIHPTSVRSACRTRFAVRQRTADDVRRPMPKEPRSERMTLRMTLALKDAVEQLADRDNRSVSDWICLRLAEAVRAEKAKLEAVKKR
jgi:hypothetical protein